jgi:uncharacterized protein
MSNITPAPRRRSFAAGFAALAAVLVPAGAARAQAPERQGQGNKLVIQVSENEPQNWGLVLNNAHNVLSAVPAGSADLEVVVFGPGISMLKLGSPVGDRVAAAMKSGIRIVACQNTMRGMHLTPADMLPNIGYVPSGVVELMQKQQQGYAYIRP